MVKRFFFLTILFPFFLKAQTYTPFPKDSTIWSQSTWHQDFYTTPPPPPIVCDQTTHYGLFGDTLIRGINYSKFYKVLDIPEFDFERAEYVGGIREDSTKKVFLFTSTDSIERLIYDFGVNVDDTVCSDYFYSAIVWPSCRVVESIDSTFFEGRFRKTIVLSGLRSENELYWIEGVGNSIGWFQYPYTGTGWWLLDCFRQHAELPYNLSACSCNPYWPGVNETNGKPEFTIDPNPAYDKITVELKSNEQYDIKLYNIWGQKLFEQRNINEALNSLEIQNLYKGVYFLILETRKGVYSKQFLKR